MPSQGWNVDIPAAEYYGPVPSEWSNQVVAGDIEPLFRELNDINHIAIDTETTGLTTWKDIPLYFSIAWGNRRATLHRDLLPHFNQFFRDPRKRWVFANAKYDAHILANVGYLFEGMLVDTQVQHSLLYEEQPHGLKYMCKTLLGWTWSDFQDTFGRIRKGFSAADLIEAAEQENFPLLVEYAANDAWGTLNVDRTLTKELKEALTHSRFREIPPYIETLWDLFIKIEAHYTKVLWKNERNGVLIDLPYLDNVKPVAEAEIVRLEQGITQEAGKIINPNSTSQLIEWLVDREGLKPLKMTGGGKSGVRKASVDAKFLEHYAEAGHKGCELLVEHRSITKMYGTYVTGLSNIVDTQGRIHTRFNQDVARCMPAGELVLTNRGYKPVEVVKKGDLVISHTGVPREVVGTSKHKPQPIYKVTLEAGNVLRTTGNHKFYTKQGEWVRADQLKEGVSVTIHSAKETWKPIEGWPYQVSSWGRVRNDSTGNILSPQPKGKRGHLKVVLSRNGAKSRGEDRKDFPIHRLVIAAFGEDTPNYVVRHKNGISWDNTAHNLEYGSTQDNVDDAKRHGTMRGAPRLKTEEVVDIRSLIKLGQPASSSPKLSYPLAERIRVQYANGFGRAELARMYEIPYVDVDNIVRDKTWVEPKEGFSAQELGDKYGVSAACIRDIWAGRRWSSTTPDQEPKAEFSSSKVVKVEVEDNERTYGLTVETDHSHVTGGIVTHNTGRLSSAEPNLQNIPNPERDNWKLRGAFIAKPGHKLIVADYKQLEMRLLACAAEEQDMVDVFLKGWDIHMGNASLVFGIPYDELVEAKKIDKMVKQGELPESHMTERVKECLHARSAAKAIGFGLNYGMGDKRLANSIGVSLAEAVEKKNQYMRTYPAVAKFYADAIAETEMTGYAFTLLGRRRNVPGIASHRKDLRNQAERIAVNTQIQGSAADVVKYAQIMLDRCGLDTQYGCHSLIQVHDELMHEVPEENVEVCKGIIKDFMEHPMYIDLAVPLDIDMAVGHSWLEAK